MSYIPEIIYIGMSFFKIDVTIQYAVRRYLNSYILLLCINFIFTGFK